MTNLDKKKDLSYPRFALDMPDDDAMTCLDSEVTVLSEAAQVSYQKHPVLKASHETKQNRTVAAAAATPCCLLVVSKASS